MNLNFAEYRDKVRACWLGKNIGGTFGAPFEGSSNMNDATTYTNIIPGEPLPNDDLDLQLIWLYAVEQNGLTKLTPRLLGEYWYDHISGPWNEYGICKANISDGFYPPVSGLANNFQWGYSNGAWIRSEIWACLCPGQPDQALKYAFMDSSCDHYGEGIYAELFTVALESAAFVIQDFRKLVAIALSKIPVDCRVARCVKLAIELYDSKKTLKEAHDAMLDAVKDMGLFQAPGNIGFVVLGLLYGEGDFSKSIIAAVNCGDDTDCTGATVGSVMGIMYGTKAIPKEWTDPIGESIQCIAINAVSVNIPKTINDLTRRVCRMGRISAQENPWGFRHKYLAHHQCEGLIPITDAPTDLSDLPELEDSYYAETRIWKKSSSELTFDLPYVQFIVDYLGQPLLKPGVPRKIRVGFKHSKHLSDAISFSFALPEGWSMNASAGELITKRDFYAYIDLEITAGSFGSDAVKYIPVTLKASQRRAPFTVNVPFRQEDACNFRMHRSRPYLFDNSEELYYEATDENDRRREVIKLQ